ncbi:50S ribosomal protein L25/general stress protein Ctc [Helicobacter sp. CLO-3]|uniref:50S ribosomal protein L25/general stress protein Ctc n=1 Tax=unclassified Helicobacter TaxID=2593540 RepID=UPI000805162C|nr:MULTISPECIES: 50S ribosomal protein L25/general stress protein Ctc [unclassified Helicobacter]OBV29079.1 50S ribosomal protein L25/general stress protein Ctc [Helicobacter sp. CLO-3]OHU81955.1 50S ribosomal protein L25/general stress protein Ctc [Helicobacter sp. CLO-3]
MLEGKIRESISKANTKALRNDGYLIANIYAKGVENIHCAFKVNDFIRAIKAKETLVFPVKVGDKTLDVVIQEYQRDPVYGTILHVDLMVAQKGVVSKYKIPVKTKGIAVGLKNKGVLLINKKRVSVKAAPENLPSFYEIDVSALDVGQSVLVRDLPENNGVKITENQSVAVVSVIKAK